MISNVSKDGSLFVARSLGGAVAVIGWIEPRDFDEDVLHAEAYYLHRKTGEHSEQAFTTRARDTNPLDPQEVLVHSVAAWLRGTIIQHSEDYVADSILVGGPYDVHEAREGIRRGFRLLAIDCPQLVKQVAAKATWHSIRTWAKRADEWAAEIR